MNEFEAVVEAVRDRVTPAAAERERLAAAVETLRERAVAALAALPVEAEVIQVGSTARGTWLAGDRDIDLFVRFPATLPRPDLEAHGLRVGHAVLPDGHEEYAEHPYVKGEYDGFEVDCVPCYGVDSAAEIQSAVDRTPFHNAYVERRLSDPARSDVRVAKAFLKGIGAYGSDLRTRGFSGYLTELLVLEYGGVRPLVAAAADWRPPIVVDPEGHGRRTFSDPLVVVDPTDPERNVAAALSPDNLARFQHYARLLLSDPSPALFEPRDPTPLSADEIRATVEARATTPVALRFPAPDVVDDQLYPQLDKSLAGVAGELDRRGFDALRSARFADESAVILVECAVGSLPAIERHAGPPVSVREHAAGFFEKYDDDPSVTGPFIEDDRYVVERPRAFRTAGELLGSEALFGVSLGVHVERALREEYDVLVGPDLASLADEFGAQLAAYFDPRP